MVIADNTLMIAVQKPQCDDIFLPQVQQHRKTEMNDDKTLKEMMLDRFVFIFNENFCFVKSVFFVPQICLCRHGRG